MEHQDPLAEAISTHLETGAVSRKGIVPYRPLLDQFSRQWISGVVLAVVKDHLEQPLIVSRQGRPSIRCCQDGQVRIKVSVLDVFQIAVGRS